MDRDFIVLSAAIVGAIAAYITAKVTGSNQLKIAKIAAEKDIQLQSERLLHDRVVNEIKLEREKLEKLHLILSKIAFENSLTMSYFLSSNDTDVDIFRNRYMENCHLLQEAMDIADFYYPEMSTSVNTIYGEMNMFWGHQEAIIQIDTENHKHGRQTNLEQVIAAGNKIAKMVSELRNSIADRGENLKDSLLHQQI
jgi:hypothetical protein